MKYILFTLIVLGIYGSVLRVERIKRIAQGKEKVYFPKRP